MTGYANEISTCKAIKNARVASDNAYGRTLYGTSELERRYMFLVKPKVLVMQHLKSLQLGKFDYQNFGQSGSEHYYADSYYRLVGVYDRKG